MKHRDIREVILNTLKNSIGQDVFFFDGRPPMFKTQDFPAVAVYLTDAVNNGNDLDADIWQATLHIEIFLTAQESDSELDNWVESKIYPALSETTYLSGLISLMIQQGYDYLRDDELGLWRSADLKYSITYEM